MMSSRLLRPSESIPLDLLCEHAYECSFTSRHQDRVGIYTERRPSLFNSSSSARKPGQGRRPRCARNKDFEWDQFLNFLICSKVKVESTQSTKFLDRSGIGEVGTLRQSSSASSHGAVAKATGRVITPAPDLVMKSASNSADGFVTNCNLREIFWATRIYHSRSICLLRGGNSVSEATWQIWYSVYPPAKRSAVICNGTTSSSLVPLANLANI